MARPDKARKSQVRREMVTNDQSARVNEAISQVKTRITVVRIAVAKFESTPVTPIFAKMAVAPAKTAESNDHVSQLFISHREVQMVTNFRSRSRPGTPTRLPQSLEKQRGEMACPYTGFESN
ncbi:MAG: hypothetical protein QOD12_121 [Verrucomicrobiota bacterium]